MAKPRFAAAEVDGLDVDEFFDPDRNALITADRQGRVQSITHVGGHWRVDEPTAKAASATYIRAFASILKLAPEWVSALEQPLSYLEPSDQGVKYHFSEEKTLLEATTIGYTQTILNVPIWRAGLSVTVKHGPYRVVHVAHTGHTTPSARLPSRSVLDDYLGLFKIADEERRQRDAHRIDPPDDRKAEGFGESPTAGFVHTIWAGRARARPQGAARTPRQKIGRSQNARLIRGRFYVYRFDPKTRPSSRPAIALETGREAAARRPPLPPVPSSIKAGEYYLVAEVTFAYGYHSGGDLVWRALVEPETGAVLDFRPLAAGVNGHVFTADPITTTGDTAMTAARTNRVLNPLRASVVLTNLDPPAGGVQDLRGTRVKVVNRTGPNVVAPSQPVGTDFVFHVRTNEFAAVNAYYHANRFFETVESLGFPVATYFPSTTFPVAVDHRGLGDVINAHFVGDGLKGIDHLCFALNDLTDIVQPVGRACDSRPHWHELGGHATLYEQIDSVNFDFAHSAGDALSAIFHAPDSNAPDPHKYAPWHPTNLRRLDRDPALGWAWGGTFDLGMEKTNEGYNAEEILATTLFRIYQSIGGDSTDPSRKRFASRMMIYLVLRAIYELTPSTSPATAVGFAGKLAAVDLLEWTSEGVFGGAYNKVIRWSFEKQGLYQAPGTKRPISGRGRPPAVDVYIDDGRHGEYDFQDVYSQTTAIWNRLSADGQTDHQRPALGTPNFAYVKVKNRGFEDAANVQVRAFHRNPGAGLEWPTDLQPMTTPSIAVGSLRANNAEEKTVGPFQWTPVDGAGNKDSMLMIVSDTKDPSNADNFAAGEVVPDWRLVPNDNNIGMRTVQPV